MPQSKNPQAVLFTVDSLIKGCGTILLPAEKRREGWEAWEFVCKFRDRTGVVHGGFLKADKSILALTIFGKGSSWKMVVSNAISLAMIDEKTTKEILVKLRALESDDEQKIILDRKKTVVQMVRYDDGQLLFKISMPAYEQAKRSKASTGQVIVALAGPSSPFPSPNLGSTLSTFKKRFDKKIDSTARLGGIKKPKQFTQNEALAYTFSTDTQLMIFAGDKKNVTQIYSCGTSKESAEFWYIVENVISCLNPKIGDIDMEEFLSELGKNKRASLPKEDAEIDDGTIKITYTRARNRYVLQVWPSHEH